jgi:hypothetical protein
MNSVDRKNPIQAITAHLSAVWCDRRSELHRLSLGVDRVVVQSRIMPISGDAIQWSTYPLRLD